MYTPEEVQRHTDSLKMVYAARIDSIQRAHTAPQTAAAPQITTTQQPAPQTTAPAATGETYTNPRTGEVYDVHTGSRGGKYILVTSRDGNVYKKYLPK